MTTRWDRIRALEEKTVERGCTEAEARAAEAKIAQLLLAQRREDRIAEKRAAEAKEAARRRAHAEAMRQASSPRPTPGQPSHPHFPLYGWAWEIKRALIFVGSFVGTIIVFIEVVGLWGTYIASDGPLFLLSYAVALITALSFKGWFLSSLFKRWGVDGD